MEAEANRGMRYQAGTLERKNTAQGPCWYLRFRVQDAEGHVTRPRFRVGLVRELPTKTAALKLVGPIRAAFNDRAARPGELQRLTKRGRTVQQVIDRYELEEMPARHSTARGYRNILNKHISPTWGARPITEVRASEIRDWLRSLPLSTKTRGHIRDMFRTLFRFAMLWEWMPLAENPMTLFRLEKSSQRTKKPRVLTPAEFAQLLKQPDLQKEPIRTMVLVAAGLGLRCSEIFGLRWKDVQWKHGLLRIERGIVEGHVDAVKTEQSQKPLPLHESLSAALLAQFERSEFQKPDDFIFASPYTSGERPYDPKYLQYYVLRPAAIAAGLGEGIGWHTFRHSYRAWLGSVGAEMGIQKDLMRHAQISTTMNVYGDSFVDHLRAANSDVVKLVIQ